MRLGPVHHHDEVIGVPDEAVRRLPVTAQPFPAMTSGHVPLPGLGEVLVEDRESDVGQQRREDATI